MSESILNDNGPSIALEAPALDEPPYAPPPRWVHYETDLSSVLAFAPRETPLEMLQVANDVAREYCARLGLEAGDRIVRHDGGRDDVLVSTDDGRRLRLALPVALLIEVEPATPA